MRKAAFLSGFLLSLLTIDLLLAASSFLVTDGWAWSNGGYGAINVDTQHVLTGIKLDKMAPTGSIIINNGDAYTNSTEVTLALTAADATPDVYQIRYSNDGTWDTEVWEAASATRTWMLPAGDGTKTVYCQVMDNAGLISSTYSGTITLDTVSPAVSITDPASGYESRYSTLTISWSGGDDASGISRYEFRLDDAPWSRIGILATAYRLTDLAEGEHVFYVKAVDRAGNEKQDTLVFVVNTRPLQGSDYAVAVAIAAALIIVALGTIAYVVRKRRKR